MGAETCDILHLREDSQAGLGLCIRLGNKHIHGRWRRRRRILWRKAYGLRHRAEDRWAYRIRRCCRDGDLQQPGQACHGTV